MSKIDKLITQSCEKYLMIGGMHLCAYYYMLAECDNDTGFYRIERLDENNRKLSGILQDVFSGYKDMKDLKDRTVALRKDVKESMYDIVAYVDKAHLLEYVLLRAKPSDKGSPKDVNDDAVARDLLSGIFKSGSNAVINDNIRKVISQLPVRMTKDKYFDLMKNELKSYVGQPRNSLDRVMYMIRSSSDMGDYPKNVIEEFDEDYRKLLEYARPGITFDEKEYACAEIEDLLDYMGDYRDGVELQMKTIDYLLVYLMNYDDVSSQSIDSVIDLKDIIDAADDIFRYGAPEQMSETLVKRFDSLAQRAETEYAELERILIELNHEHDKETEPALSLQHRFSTDFYLSRFMLCDKLLSGSAFAELDFERDPDRTPVTVEELDVRFNEFCVDFNRVTAGALKSMTRARMASTFTCIPPFFNNRTEVMNYVLDSLKGCRDLHEKTAAIEQAKYYLNED